MGQCDVGASVIPISRPREDEIHLEMCVGSLLVFPCCQIVSNQIILKFVCHIVNKRLPVAVEVAHYK